MAGLPPDRQVQDAVDTQLRGQTASGSKPDIGPPPELPHKCHHRRHSEEPGGGAEDFIRLILSDGGRTEPAPEPALARVSM